MKKESTTVPTIHKKHTTIWTKLVSIVLILALLLGCIPINTVFAAKDEDEYVEVISETAPLRKGPYERKAVVATVASGDCLRVLGKTRNAYGNAWYKLSYGGATVYCYASHLVSHSHKYVSVTNDLSLCKCGAYELEDTRAMKQTGMLLDAGTLVTAELIAAAASLGASATATLSVAFPYVAVVAISSMLIYMAVSASGTQVQVEEVTVIQSIEDVDWYNESADPQTPYHKACTLPGTGAILIQKEGMDLSAANKYLRDAVKNPAYATVTELSKNALLSIWCPTIYDATILAERFGKNGIDFGYGDSTGYNCRYEANKDASAIWFQHYHLWYRAFNQYSMKKVDDAHIFFSGPVIVDYA